MIKTTIIITVVFPFELSSTEVSMVEDGVGDVSTVSVTIDVISETDAAFSKFT